MFSWIRWTSVLVLLLTLFCAPAVAKESEAAHFWVAASEDLQNSKWQVFVPEPTELRKRGMLFYGKLDKRYQPSQSREILGELYAEIEDFRVLGSKSVAWAQRPATLLSFSGRAGKQVLRGRAVLADSGLGTELLLLIGDRGSHTQLEKNFRIVRKQWPAGLPIESE